VVGRAQLCAREDAVEFMLAGATAVQVGTASYARSTGGGEYREWAEKVVFKPRCG